MYRCVHGPHARDAIVVSQQAALCPRPICKSFCLASGGTGCGHERLAARAAQRMERGVRHGSCRARSGLCVGLCVGVEQPAGRQSFCSARPAGERRRFRAAAACGGIHLRRRDAHEDRKSYAEGASPSLPPPALEPLLSVPHLAPFACSSSKPLSRRSSMTDSLRSTMCAAQRGASGWQSRARNTSAGTGRQ